MRKQQICILSSLKVETIKSIKDIPSIIDEFTEIQQKAYSEAESKRQLESDYLIYSFEQQKKFSDASEVILKSLPNKMKLNGKKGVVRYKQIRKYLKDVCGLLINWVKFCLQMDKKSQAYSILQVLQSVTDKEFPIKFTGRKFVRIKIYL